MVPRAPVPSAAVREIAVRPPPEVPRPADGNPLARLVPVVMVVATVGMVVFYFSAAGSSGRNPMFALFPLMMLGSLIGTLAYNGRGGKRTAEINDDRREYLRHLSTVEGAATDVAAAQRLSSDWNHPDPASLWAVAGSHRRWERGASHGEFAALRVGLAALPLSARFTLDQRPDTVDHDPVTVAALRAMMDKHAAVPGLAVTVHTARTRAVAVTGEPAYARAVVRAMLCQLVTFHAPDTVRIVAVAEQQHWDWLKWLPHHQHPTARDACGPARMSYARVAQMISQVPSAPALRVIVVVEADVADAHDAFGLLEADWADAVTVVTIGEPEHRSLTRGVELRVDRHRFTMTDDAGTRIEGVPDALTTAQAAATARRMAGCADRADAAQPGAAQGSSWQCLVGLGDPGGFDVRTSWLDHGPRHRLRVPIGVGQGGAVVELDIKEAAEGGFGPHGLCVGATGSGKSELLRTLVLGMVARHSPDVLNLVLVDFKGGATFLGLDGLPHVAAVITNLADEAPLVARMRDALAGEMYRRQELLRSAGHHANVAEYEAARAGGARMPPLPALFIVVDEFSELLSQHPDLAELFATIGRLGRSLRMHLLLASQRLDEGRMRGLETHLSYRICLKTFSASESRAAIGVADAYELPALPGAGYLRLGAGELIRFDTAFVSGPYRRPVPRATESDAADVPVLFTAAPLTAQSRGAVVHVDAGPQTTVLHTVVQRLRGNGAPAHRIWLPPLDAPPALSSLLVPTPAPPGVVVPVPIGVVDCPFEQRRTPLLVDVAGAAGHVAVVGAPQSGKSTAVRTLVSALALIHDPGQVQFYCLDFGGGGLSALRELPHVGAVATRFQADLVRRTVAEMEAVIQHREKAFATCGVDSMADYRRRVAAGDPVLPADRYGDVFLVVDGWAALRQDFDDLEAVIVALAARGLSHGVHVVVTASRWAELRPAFKDLVGTRIELRLGDPADSEMDRKQARVVAHIPGRGLSGDGKLTAIALPRLDGSSATEGMAAAAEAVTAAVRRRSGARCAPAIRLLPAHVDRADVPVPGDSPAPGCFVIGVSENDLLPAAIDFEQQPHLIVIGDGGSGKTAALRTLCREIVARNTPAQARVMLVDVRRTLLGVVDDAHLVDYAVSGSAVTQQLPRLLDLLRARLPGHEVTQHQLRHRSWWTGPDVYLVVDDYDLVAGSDGNPLAAIAKFAPHARDVGLHVIVARRSGGAGRAMYEPLLARLRDCGATGMLMSASPDEGMIWNSVRPSPLPPGRAVLIGRTGAELIHVAWTA